MSNTAGEQESLYQFYGQETLIDFRARAEKVLIKIISEYPQDSRLAVISHGKMINMLFRCFMKLPVNLCCRRHFIKRSTKCETNRPVKVWIMKDWIMKDWIMKDC
ncbi:MAG: histidine phosphatase family protein [Firmicutes bacterium]|nr:histidine phosphatase family protein [Bacillota bacterium]